MQQAGSRIWSEALDENPRYPTRRLRVGTQSGTILDVRRPAGENGESHRDEVTLNHLPDRLPVCLAAWHVLLFAITVLFGRTIATDGNPLFCVDLPASLPLVARDDVLTVVLVGAISTGWWYFVGQVGRASWAGRMSRTISFAGALLLLSIQAAAWFAMISESRLISQEADFGPRDVLVYALAAVLLLGGLTSAAYAMSSVVRPRQD
jgi:predicted secreted protein